MSYINKYLNEYIKTISGKRSIEFLQSIINSEDKYGDIIKWKKDSIIDLLRSYHSTGVGTLIDYKTTLKGFIIFIKKHEGLPINESEYNVSVDDIIDINRFLEITFKPSQIQQIIVQLKANARDRLMARLAAQLFMVDEMRLIKEDDIKFEKNSIGIEYAVITLKNREVKITDHNTVEDLHKTLKEYEYTIDTIDGKTKHLQYIISNYLFKPVKMGRAKNYQPLKAFGTAFKSGIVNQNVKVDGINSDDITLDNIRTSKIIYLLAPDNVYFNRDSVTKLIGNSNADTECMKFYERMAAQIYPSKK
jgi:hypothetical protein